MQAVAERWHLRLACRAHHAPRRQLRVVANPWARYSVEGRLQQWVKVVIVDTCARHAACHVLHVASFVGRATSAGWFVPERRVIGRWARHGRCVHSTPSPGSFIPAVIDTVHTAGSVRAMTLDSALIGGVA